MLARGLARCTLMALATSSYLRPTTLAQHAAVRCGSSVLGKRSVSAELSVVRDGGRRVLGDGSEAHRHRLSNQGTCRHFYHRMKIHGSRRDEGVCDLVPREDAKKGVVGSDLCGRHRSFLPAS